MKSVFDDLAEEIFSIVNGSGRKVTLWDAENNLVYNPSESRRLFAEPDKMMISIFESGHDSTVKMYIGNTTKLEKVLILIDRLRATATRYNVLFEVRRYGKEIDPKIFARQTRDVAESIDKLSSMVNISKADNKFIEERKETTMTQKIPVTERTHKLQIGPKTTLFVYEQIVKASRVLSKLVVEHEGKKLKYPNNCLYGAKAMARHLAEGGRPLSNLGQYIVNLSERVEKLQQLGRYVTTNESRIPYVKSFVRVMAESINKAKKELTFISDADTYQHALKESRNGKLPKIVNESNHKGVKKLAESLKINQGKLFNTVPVLFNIIDGKNTLNEAVLSSGEAEHVEPMSDKALGIGQGEGGGPAPRLAAPNMANIAMKEIVRKFAEIADQGAAQGSDKFHALKAQKRAGTPEIAKLEQWFNNFDPDKILTEGPFVINPAFKSRMFGSGAEQPEGGGSPLDSIDSDAYSWSSKPEIDDLVGTHGLEMSSHHDGRNTINMWTSPGGETVAYAIVSPNGGATYFTKDDFSGDEMGLDDEYTGPESEPMDIAGLEDDEYTGPDSEPMDIIGLSDDDLGDDEIPEIDGALGGDKEVDEESWASPHGHVLDDVEDFGELGVDGDDFGISTRSDPLTDDRPEFYDVHRDDSYGRAFESAAPRRLRDANVQGGFKKEIVQNKPKNDPNEDDDLNRLLILAGRKK